MLNQGMLDFILQQSGPNSVEITYDQKTHATHLYTDSKFFPSYMVEMQKLKFNILTHRIKISDSQTKKFAQ